MMNRLLLFIFICSFLSACNSTRNETHNNLSEDSVPHKGLTKSPQQSINETSFANKPESIDTVHDGWHLTMEEFYDGTVYKDKYDNGNTQYAVYALRINITKDGKRIIKDKVITPKSHSGKTDGTEFMFNNLPDVFFSPTTCYLEMYVCEPETDNCLGKILAFSPSCSVSEYYLTDCMGEEIDSSTSAISCFFCYIHARNLITPSVPNRHRQFTACVLCTCVIRKTVTPKTHGQSHLGKRQIQTGMDEITIFRVRREQNRPSKDEIQKIARHDSCQSHGVLPTLATPSVGKTDRHRKLKDNLPNDSITNHMLIKDMADCKPDTSLRRESGHSGNKENGYGRGGELLIYV